VLTDPDRRAAYDTFLDRFGPETGHETYEQWADSGGDVAPENWDPADESTGASGTTTDTRSSRGSTNRSGRASSSGGQSASGSATRSGTDRSRGRGSGTAEETSTSRERSSGAGRTTSGSSGRSTGTTSRRRSSTTDSRRSRTVSTGKSTRERTETPARTVHGGWQGVLYRQGARLRERVGDSVLAVFLPAAGLLRRGLGVVARPGVFVRGTVPTVAQVTLVAALTLGGYASLLTDSPVALVGPLLWVLSTVILYAGGIVIWLIAVVATATVTGVGPALYTSVAALVTVLGYYLMVALSAGPPDETDTD
jgi:hypothetical protein